MFHNHPERLGSRAAYEAVWAQWETEHGFRVRSCRSLAPAVQLIGADVAVFTHDVVTDVEFDGEVSTGHERETIVFHHRDAGWIAVHEHLSTHDDAQP